MIGLLSQTHTIRNELDVGRTIRTDLRKSCINKSHDP